MVKYIIQNWKLVTLSTSILVVSFQTLELKHDVSSINYQTQKSTEQITSSVSSDIARALTLLEFIGDSEIRTYTYPYTAEEGHVYASVTYFEHLEQSVLKQYIKTHYELEQSSPLLQLFLNHDAPLWRAEFAKETKSNVLIMGKPVRFNHEDYLVEVTFDLRFFPPLVSDQINAEMMFVRSDDLILHKSQAVAQELTSDLSELEKHKLLGYEYYQLVNNDSRQFQVVNVPIEALNGEFIIVVDSTDYLQSIEHDVRSLSFVIFAIIVFCIMSEFILRYMNKTQDAMNRDPLTGLNNRRYFNDSQHRMNKSFQDGSYQLYGVLMLDIDHFKQVNDKYGHGIGDEVLKRFGQILKENLRDGDDCYRLGGEEFAITAPIMMPSQVVSLANRLKDKIQHDRRLNELVDNGITTSIGVALFTFGDDLEQSVKKADEQLYLAKHNGRNLVQHAIELYSKNLPTHTNLRPIH